MRKRVYILGILLGLLSPVIGIFLGLQVSTTLGNMFAFPVIALVFLTGSPFGEWHLGLTLAAAVLSIVIWTGIFAALDRLLRRS